VSRAAENADAPRCLVEPTTGRPILMAPQRQLRPMHTGAAAGARPCPFCQGQEAQTPPEVDAVRDADTPADRPGWTVRAFANKYPAAAQHDVIAEGREHCEQPADLDVRTWRAALAVWQRRVRAIEQVPGVHGAYLFKNVGALAGASIAHNHTQILGLAELPPRLQLEVAVGAQQPRCPWCATLALAERDGRLVFGSRAHAVIVPEPPKLPHETWLLPRACDDDFLATDLDSLAIALHALFAAVCHGLGRPAFNLWLHRVPVHRLGGGRFHWHVELQPRTGQLAGLELGGDMYINSIPAAASAAKLRQGLAALARNGG
jgi:UDPglucose--hexose-1-phosphate uridylyltransferase